MEAVEIANVFMDEMERIRKQKIRSTSEQKLLMALSEGLGYIDKSIPKQIVRGTHHSVFCPKCGNMDIYKDDWLHNYCPECGQKIIHVKISNNTRCG